MFWLINQNTTMWQVLSDMLEGAFQTVHNAIQHKRSHARVLNVSLPIGKRLKLLRDVNDVKFNC